MIFGGWANKWLDDVWQINVSSIVGPPYAITKARCDGWEGTYWLVGLFERMAGRVEGRGKKNLVKGDVCCLFVAFFYIC